MRETDLVPQWEAYWLGFTAGREARKVFGESVPLIKRTECSLDESVYAEGYRDGWYLEPPKSFDPPTTLVIVPGPDFLQQRQRFPIRLLLVAFVVRFWRWMPRRVRLWAFLNDDMPQ